MTLMGYLKLPLRLRGGGGGSERLCDFDGGYGVVRVIGSATLMVASEVTSEAKGRWG